MKLVCQQHLAPRQGWPASKRSAIVLGNNGDEEAVPTLITALQTEKSSMVRETVAWALGQIGGEEALKGLTSQLALETDASVLEELKKALNHCK
ncbi:MAG: HEAT repeat domain-containing protein [Planctomycetaceae bacterium]